MVLKSANERGLAPLIIVIIVAVVGIVGASGYMVATRKSASPEQKAADALQRAIQDAPCPTEDENLCKFYKSWKANENYRFTSTLDGATSIFEVDGDKHRMKVSGETAFETISVGNTLYTKGADGTWWKQSLKAEDAAQYKADSEFSFDDDISSDNGPKVTYKNHGKEACGSLTCFKYETIDPSAPNDKDYFWFDDKEYKLHKMRTETSDGVSETTVEYDNITVSIPSPVKELGPDQYIVPGQSQPMTMPSAADLQADFPADSEN